MSMEAWMLFIGVSATLISLYLGLKFRTFKHPLAYNISYMALGGALAGFSTLIFSFTSFLGEYGELPTWLVNVLRICIFGGLSIADILMLLRLKQIENSNE